MRPIEHNFRTLVTCRPVQWLSIIEAVARQWSLERSEIESKARCHNFVEARDACVALALQLTQLDCTEIAHRFGNGRTRTAIGYSVRRAERRFRDEPEWARAYLAVLNRIIAMHGGLDTTPTVLVKPEERKVAG